MDSSLWRVIDSSSLFFEEWEQDAIIYNGMSGETHKLNALAIEILKLMLQKSWTPISLTEEICSIFDFENDAVLLQNIKQVINQFNALGLIEPQICEN